MSQESNKASRETRPGHDRELRVHDGIVAAIILASVVAGVMVHPACLWLAGVTSAIMLSSAFTGFCPIHFVLCKLIPVAD